MILGDKVHYGTDAARTLVQWGSRGFRHEGRLRQDRFQDGRYLDTLVMGLLREEYGGA
jgi:hypothetical protein